MHRIAALSALLAGSAFGANDWIDPDTPEAGQTTHSLVDGRTLDLVFSDEFEIPGRTFDDGHDPRWTAINKNDYTNDALHYYDKDYVFTSNGFLNITTSAAHTPYMGEDAHHKPAKKIKNFKSGMIQGWNKFCFTGGIIEVRATLPGNAYIGGFWPAIWLMGNLARATYVGSSDWVWPWSYNQCDRDIQKKQLVSQCNPYPHFDFHGHEGRGAPEIDILEAMPGKAPMLPSDISKPYFSASLQVAPGIEDKNRPQKGMFPWPGTWYENLEYGPNTSQNIYFYGSRTEKPNYEYSYQADALSGNTQLNAELWEQPRNFRLEWQPPASDPEKKGGYVRWFFDETMVYGVTGKSLGSKLGAEVPSEPSYAIMNTAMSSTWGFPEGETGCPKNCECECYDCLDESGKCACGFAKGFCDSLPGHFLIDYVRVWQDLSDPVQKVGCSTPERPTKKWIEGHADNYKSDDDDVPLQPLQVGGGKCHEDSTCGGLSPSASSSSSSGPNPPSSSTARGACRKQRCACADGWVGPHCAAAAAGDPQSWEHPATLGFAAPVLPPLLVALYVALAFLLAFALVSTVNKFRADSNKAEALVLETIRASVPGTISRVDSATEQLIASQGGGNGHEKQYTMGRVQSEVMLSNMSGE